MANVTTPSKERWVMVLILLLTLLVAYIDRVNVSVLMADNTFLTDMGIKGDPVSMGLLMTRCWLPGIITFAYVAMQQSFSLR